MSFLSALLPCSSFGGLSAIGSGVKFRFLSVWRSLRSDQLAARCPKLWLRFLARISGRGRGRRTDVEPSQNRKMQSDLFGSSQAAQMLSTLVIIIAIAPIVGPLLGGAILEFGSWHGIFWLMALTSAVMFVMIFFCRKLCRRKSAPQSRSHRRLEINRKTPNLCATLLA